MNICIIPARGGSKRLPGKNIKLVDGVPIINRVIDAVVYSNIFDKIIVSTDCKEVKSVVMGHSSFEKIKIHSRSLVNSSDFATLSAVVDEVLKGESLNEDDSILTILPTALLTTSKDLINSSNTLNLRLFNTVPVVRAYQPIDRALSIENGKLFFINKYNKNTRTQDCPEYFFDAGQFYWVNYRCFLLEKSLVSSLSTPYIMDEMDVQDIDTENDWCTLIKKYKIKD